MPQIIETMSRRVHWGWVATNTGSKGHSDWGNIEADWNSIDSKMSDLAATLNDEGWEIRSVVPLTGSRYYTTALTNQEGMSSTWGAGYGYGAGYTEGVIVLCQRWVEISQEEADRRQAIRNANAKSKADAAAAKQRQAEHDKIMALPVSRKGIFDAQWRFNGSEFASKEEAEKARIALAKTKLELA